MHNSHLKMIIMYNNLKRLEILLPNVSIDLICLDNIQNDQKIDNYP